MSVDSAQVIGCVVTMRSITEHVKPGVCIRFHVMTNRISTREEAVLCATVEESVGSHEIAVIPVDVREYRGLLRSRLISHTAYARFFLDRVLPEDVERCIYVDCDLVVRRDITEAWSTDLRGRTVAAVSDGNVEGNRENAARLNLREARYFNSGLLVIDVARWRQRTVSAQSFDAARFFGDKLVLHDQDALNYVLQDDWIELPREWNAAVPWCGWLQEDSKAVFHYMGSPKPWEVDYNRRFGELFLQYLDRTPLARTRPWNPFGLGALTMRLRRRLPYWPTVIRRAMNTLGARRT